MDAGINATGPKRLRLAILSVVVLGLLPLMAACSSSEPEPELTPASAEATPTTAAVVQSPIDPVSEPTLVPLPTELFLTVSSPEDEIVVSSELITVSGMTTPDAVVSVNGQIIDVDALGEFSASVVLLEGPNLIEVVSSDLSTQVSADLAVIYIL